MTTPAPAPVATVATVEFQTSEGLYVDDHSVFVLPFGFTPAEGFAVATLAYAEHYCIGTPTNVKIILH